MVLRPPTKLCQLLSPVKNAVSEHMESAGYFSSVTCVKSVKHQELQNNVERNTKDLCCPEEYALDEHDLENGYQINFHDTLSWLVQTISSIATLQK